MARQQLTLEFNSFVKGLITEAGPLTFPENASLDERNFVLNKDGSRKRRLGMDVEVPGYTVTVSSSSGRKGLVTQAYSWRNVAGNSNRTIVVCQVGSELLFYDASDPTITDSLLFREPLVVEDYEYASFATVNGMLVVANGGYDLQIFKFEDPVLTKSTYRLKIRDFFGLEAVYEGNDYREGNYIPRRLEDMVTPPPEFEYNWRNQSFGVARRVEDLTFTSDPLTWFHTRADVWPSNADNVNVALYPDNNNSENRLIDRFFPRDLRDNPPISGHAANGHFIIDALTRGSSRINAYQEMLNTSPALTNYGGIYPADYTPKGAKVVKEFAGRVFYAGFSDEIVAGDRYSPRLGSFVMFSQLVKNETDLGKCYQEADPTSPDMSDIVATDGGFVRIEGAYNIQAMEVINSTLVIFAQNGVWSVTGGSDYGFEATNYRVDKISERGIIAPKSVVNADGSLLFWGASGIFAIQPNQMGTLALENITSTTIQSFYDNISVNDKNNAKAVFDSYKRQVRWLYSTDMSETTSTQELILDIGLGAFYPSVIASSLGPKVVAPLITPPFTEGLIEEDVTVLGVTVTVLAEDVTLTRSVLQPVLSEIKYLTIESSTSTTIDVCFSYYTEQSFADWKSVNGTGVDANAYVITGYTTLKESQREKANPYITFYFNKSEKGFETDEAGDLFPINPSSCIVQAQWEWTNSANSNRWGRPFQAYRHKRVYFPTDVDDLFEDGNSVVVTKNKLRGYGRALSLKLSTEPAKDCQILGWSQLLTVESNV